MAITAWPMIHRYHHAGGDDAGKRDLGPGDDLENGDAEDRKQDESQESQQFFAEDHEDEVVVGVGDKFHFSRAGSTAGVARWVLLVGSGRGGCFLGRDGGRAGVSLHPGSRR
ncbi:hypothetical protein [Arthrobacter sp. NPDC056493]|uniref:hypothetical protein n=1 Tax=Arthrobacter sp. NPDC056493 TaxID=3345839 RepID=UPI003672D8E6